MSMTKSEFMQHYGALCRESVTATGRGPHSSEVAALAERAGVEWDPMPTPEPTGDLSMVRVIDAVGNTWGPRPDRRWSRLIDRATKPWSDIPQPATVLRPEGSASRPA